MSRSLTNPVLLLNPSRINFQVPITLNLATLLPNQNLKASFHDFEGILARVCCVPSDLQDTLLSDAKETWFTDGSSYVEYRCRYAGATVTMTSEVIWAETLPPDTWAQKDKLIALIKALKLEKNKKINIYTDSR